MLLAANQTRGAWDKKAQHVRAIICLSLTNKQLGKVMKWTTLKQVLAVLDGEYQSIAPANKILLKKNLFKFKMLDDVVITQHIHTYKTLLQSLSAIKVTVLDEDMAICLILSLPPSYDMLTTALKVQAEGLSFVKLKAALVNKALKQKAKSDKLVTEGVLFSQHKKNPTRPPHLQGPHPPSPFYTRFLWKLYALSCTTQVREVLEEIPTPQACCECI